MYYFLLFVCHLFVGYLISGDSMNEYEKIVAKYFFTAFSIFLFALTTSFYFEINDFFDGQTFVTGLLFLILSVAWNLRKIDHTDQSVKWTGEYPKRGLFDKFMEIL